MPRGGSYEVDRDDQAVENTISIEDQFWNALRGDEEFDAEKWKELGVDLNMRNSDGYPAIVVAHKNSKTDNVKKLILSGADATLTGSDQYTLLMRAASGGDMDFITWLLDNTAIDINAQDKDGDTAVNEAVYHQKPQTASLLLDRGADPYILNYKNESLWDWAKKTENQ
ncbi:MAG: ankyrin repeat domain-containing protein, partial [Alphaproteobacteria bacterium]